MDGKSRRRAVALLVLVIVASLFFVAIFGDGDEEPEMAVSEPTDSLPDNQAVPERSWEDPPAVPSSEPTQAQINAYAADLALLLALPSNQLNQDGLNDAIGRIALEHPPAINETTTMIKLPLPKAAEGDNGSLLYHLTEKEVGAVNHVFPVPYSPSPGQPYFMVYLTADRDDPAGPQLIVIRSETTVEDLRTFVTEWVEGVAQGLGGTTVVIPTSSPDGVSQT